MIKALFIHLCASIRTQLFWFRTSDFISWPRKIWEMSFDVHCTLPRNTLYAVLNRFQAKTRSTNPKMSFRRVLKHGIGSSLPPVFACPWPGLLKNASRGRRIDSSPVFQKVERQDTSKFINSDRVDRGPWPWRCKCPWSGEGSRWYRMEITKILFTKILLCVFFYPREYLFIFPRRSPLKRRWLIGYQFCQKTGLFLEKWSEIDNDGFR